MDYYIGPNGELYHGLFGKGKGKPRDDHKYIKREWKNGRWQYTYKTDSKSKGLNNVRLAENKKSQNGNADPTGAKAEQRYTKAQEKYRNITNRINEKLMSNIHYREASYGRGTEYVSKNDRAARAKAVEEYARDKAEQKRAKTELDNAEKAYKQTARYKLKNIPSTLKGVGEGVKQKAKDLLGYDEKALRDAMKKANEAPSTNATHVINGKETKVDWGKEYADAQKEYMKTPLGLLETVTDPIHKYAESRKTDWEESKERAYQKDVEAAAKRGADVQDTDRLGSSRTTITFGNVKFVTEKRGKIEQYVDTAKEYVKDRLGFDEKAVYDDAKSQQRLTSLKKSLEQSNININAKLDNPLADKTIVEAAKRIEKLNEQLKRDSEKTKKARKKYAKTIAGKVDLWLEDFMGIGR